MKVIVYPNYFQKKKIGNLSCLKLGGGGSATELRKRGWRTAKTTFHYTYMYPPIPLPRGTWPTLIIDVPSPKDIWTLAHALHRRGTKTQSTFREFTVTYTPPYVFRSTEYREVNGLMRPEKKGTTLPAEFEICKDSLWSVSATWGNGSDYRPR